MAKSRERLLAREMRRKGESIREIAKKLEVSKSSVSLWCGDIVLTVERVGQISNRELFLIGLALYWAEGSKTGRRIIFVNSDAAMICLFIRWIRECFVIPIKDVSCRVQINETHTYRMKDIEKYWSDITGIPLSQFTKTTLIRAVTKKVYDHPDLYFGVLAIKVKRSTNMSYLIYGGIQYLRKYGSLMVQ